MRYFVQYSNWLSIEYQTTQYHIYLLNVGEHWNSFVIWHFKLSIRICAKSRILLFHMQILLTYQNQFEKQSNNRKRSFILLEIKCNYFTTTTSSWYDKISSSQKNLQISKKFICFHEYIELKHNTKIKMHEIHYISNQ